MSTSVAVMTTSVSRFGTEPRPKTLWASSAACQIPVLHLRFSRAVTMNITVFFEVTLCTLIDHCKCFLEKPVVYIARMSSVLKRKKTGSPKAW
jgi:hypothetical protein